MERTIQLYLEQLHGRSSLTKYLYASRLRRLGVYLKKDFRHATKTDLDQFLTGFKKETTFNHYAFVIRDFYRWLGKKFDFKPFKIEVKPVSPAELLTVEDIIKLARSMPLETYRTATLVLYESSARVSEILGLRVGDVSFDSVKDTDGNRRLPRNQSSSVRSQSYVLG
jgi:integrase